MMQERERNRLWNVTPGLPRQSGLMLAAGISWRAFRRAAKRTSVRSFAPPAFGERRHRRLARRLIAVRRRAILVMPKGQRPQPRQSNWRLCGVEDTADNDAIGEYVIVLVIPLAGCA
jgi:hypothetical protein